MKNPGRVRWKMWMMCLLQLILWAYISFTAEVKVIKERLLEPCPHGNGEKNQDRHKKSKNKARVRVGQRCDARSHSREVITLVVGPPFVPIFAPQKDIYRYISMWWRETLRWLPRRPRFILLKSSWLDSNTLSFSFANTPTKWVGVENTLHRPPSQLWWWTVFWYDRIPLPNSRTCFYQLRYRPLYLIKHYTLQSSSHWWIKWACKNPITYLVGKDVFRRSCDHKSEWLHQPCKRNGNGNGKRGRKKRSDTRQTNLEQVYIYLFPSLKIKVITFTRTKLKSLLRKKTQMTWRVW